MNASSGTCDRWHRCADVLPNDGEAAETKIDDGKEERNIQRLKKRGNLWFFPDDSMYVYYTPTHWRH